MGKCLTFFLLLVALNAIICLIFLRSQKLLIASNDSQSAQSSNLNGEVDASSNSTESSISEKSHRTFKLLSDPAFPFEYIINPSNLCERTSEQSHKIAFLVLVHTAAGNLAERQAIRTTWGSPATLKKNRGPSLRIAFLLGSTSKYNVQASILQEADTHGDIIQADFVDSYQNLTLKSIMMLKWTTEHCTDRAIFLLKTDDDMYVNLQNLFKVASKLPASKNAMYGILFRKAHPDRNPKAKWFVPKSQFPGKEFPDYLSGTAYAMTMDVVPKVYRASLTNQFMMMEDIFITGICASAVRVKRFQIKGFSHLKRPPTGCGFRDAVTGHHVTVQHMRQIWRDLANKTKMAHCPSTAARKISKRKT